jgi:hypothetical protein
MKMTRRQKLILFTLSFLLYASGALAWILSKWFQINEGFGPTPSPWAATTLHGHGILSLFFIFLIGMIVESHVKKGWKAARKRKSGLFLLLPLFIVMLTVPGLYYLNDGWLKVTVTQIHVFLGLALLLPAFLHPLTNIKKRRHFRHDD